MLQPGNSKLGLLVWSWSLPAGLTCPGKTNLCSKLCYALSGHFCAPNVQNALARSYELAQAPGFATWMMLEVRRTFARVIRIHASGDFYSAKYTRDWLKVIRAYPDVIFYAYTRSWIDPQILKVLRLMAREKNCLLWFSCDREMKAPPRVKNVRRAWLAVDDNDVAPYLVDLVFRDRTFTVMRRDKAGFPVCPHEYGLPQKPTCSTCKKCFTLRRPHGPSNQTVPSAEVGADA